MMLYNLRKFVILNQVEMVEYYTIVFFEKYVWKSDYIIATLIFQIKFVCSNVHYAEYKMHTIFENQSNHSNVIVATGSHSYILYIKYMLSSNLEGRINVFKNLSKIFGLYDLYRIFFKSVDQALL